jgi:hypothetical protein
MNLCFGLFFVIWTCCGNFLHYVQTIESDSQDLELDLSSLNTVNTVFAALFR